MPLEWCRSVIVLPLRHDGSRRSRATPWPAASVPLVRRVVTRAVLLGDEGSCGPSGPTRAPRYGRTCAVPRASRRPAGGSQPPQRRVPDDAPASRGGAPSSGGALPDAPGPAAPRARTGLGLAVRAAPGRVGARRRAARSRGSRCALVGDPERGGPRLLPPELAAGPRPARRSSWAGSTGIRTERRDVVPRSRGRSSA